MRNSTDHRPFPGTRGSEAARQNSYKPWISLLPGVELDIITSGLQTTYISPGGAVAPARLCRRHDRSRLDGINAYPFSILAKSLVFNNPVHHGEQGIITTEANIGARMDLGAQLTNQDIPGPNHLTAKTLYTTSLARAISTVS